jgi:hypothetical protein
MTSPPWLEEWPRCLLLFELTRSHAASGRAQGCAKLMARLEESRARMAEAPPPIQSFLSELRYVVWLLLQGEVGEARHHAREADFKISQIERLLQRLQSQEARSLSVSLWGRSIHLRFRADELLARSARLITRSLELQRKYRSIGRPDLPYVS